MPERLTNVTVSVAAMFEAPARRVSSVPGFPELRDVAVTWAPLPEPAAEQAMRHTAGSWRPVIPCDNPACRRGGFDLGPLVALMVSFREAEKAGLLVCSGWEGEELPDPAAGVPCVRSIRYRLLLTYGASAPKPPGASPRVREGDI
jgi:hypothetical protein